MKRKIKKKVVVLSLLALVFLVLTYVISWWFLVPIAVILYLNQRELMKRH